MSGPFSFDGTFRRLWMTWRRNTAGSFLLPVNFYQYIDISGTDPSKWKILKVSLSLLASSSIQYDLTVTERRYITDKFFQLWIPS